MPTKKKKPSGKATKTMAANRMSVEPSKKKK